MSVPLERLYGVKVREGFSVGDLCRPLREPKADLKSDFFRDPGQLAVDFLAFLLAVFASPFIWFWRRLTLRPKSLRGKVAIVTGSGRGLGREICLALAREGVILACADINVENNNETLKLLKSAGATAKAYKLNVANKAEVEETIEKVEKELGPIYLLVNNAAIVATCKEVDEEFIRAMFNVNTLGPIWAISAILPKMMERNDGHIVCISSMAAAAGTPLLSIYGASKAALSNYTQAIRSTLDLIKDNMIHVTSIHPLFINTSADYMDMVTSRIPVLSCRRTAAYVVHAIQHNFTDCSPTPFPFFIYSIAKYFSVEVIRAGVKFGNFRANLPTLQDLQKLPQADLVKQGNQISGGPH